MTGVHIRVRTLGSGEKRYDVRYRRGGRGFKVEHGGTFTNQREAKLRHQLIAGELAAGRDPREAVRPKPAPALLTGAQVAAAYKASRVDLVNFPDSHLKRFLDHFGDTVLADLRWTDGQAWVNELSEDLAASSLRKYVDTGRLIFDFAEVDPNPLRDRRVKLPRIVQQEIVPPSSRELLALLETIVRRHRLPVVLLEQTAMTVGELCTLAWGDVDSAGLQFRLKRANVKGQIASRARWVQVPGWLMALVEELCPLEDRTPERRVFSGLTASALRSTMRRACAAAGIPNFHPHDLRHRRLSLWHGQGVPARHLAERAGHANATLTLNTYSHVMPDDELAPAALEAVLR